MASAWGRSAWVEDERDQVGPDAIPASIAWWPWAGRTVDFTVTREVLGAMDGDGKLALQLWSPKGRDLAEYATPITPIPAKRPAS